MTSRLTPIFALLLVWVTTHAQPLTNDFSAYRATQDELAPVMREVFETCLVQEHLDVCTEKLQKAADSPWKQLVVGDALFDIAPEVSFPLHEQAFKAMPDEMRFALEYAMENHRKGNYATAIPPYLRIVETEPEDFRTHVWLSECYLNTRDDAKAIEHWKKADHAKNHTRIDFALHAIHGETGWVRKRSELIEKVKQGDVPSAYELIFQDGTWEIDWWNTNVQIFFLKPDLELIKESLGASNPDYQRMAAYAQIKEKEKSLDAEELSRILKENNLLLDGQPFYPHGNSCSDLYRLAFQHKLLDKKTVFTERGQELWDKAIETKDVHYLNVYANLEYEANGSVSAKTDKTGWQTFGDARFAISYFHGLGDKNTHDNPDLEKAVADFPESAGIYAFRFGFAHEKGLATKQQLVDLIKREFRSLESSPTRYSDRLNFYFQLLEKDY